LFNTKNILILNQAGADKTKNITQVKKFSLKVTFKGYARLAAQVLITSIVCIMES
jgi:hypothetical protein